MKYEFVSFGKVETFDNIKDIPYCLTSYTENLSLERSMGRCVHCKELDNQPIFYGWVGPMLDGGVLRYETEQVYDILST